MIKGLEAKKLIHYNEQILEMISLERPNHHAFIEFTFHLLTSLRGIYDAGPKIDKKSVIERLVHFGGMLLSQSFSII